MCVRTVCVEVEHVHHSKNRNVVVTKTSYALSVECCTQGCYCELVTNPYVNFQTSNVQMFRLRFPHNRLEIFIYC